MLFRAGRLFAICDVFLVMRHSSQPDLAERRQQGEVKLINNSILFFSPSSSLLYLLPSRSKKTEKKKSPSPLGEYRYLSLRCGKAERKKKPPASVLWQSSNLIQNLAQLPHPPHAVHTQSHKQFGCPTHASRRVCTKMHVCTREQSQTDTQPGAAIVF